MESYQNPLCRLYLSPYFVRRKDDHHLQILYIEFNKDNQTPKHKTEVLVAEIETSKICID